MNFQVYVEWMDGRQETYNARSIHHDGTELVMNIDNPMVLGSRGDYVHIPLASVRTWRKEY